MNAPAPHRIRPLVKVLRRVVLPLLLAFAIILKAGLPEARVASAAPAPAPAAQPPICTVTGGCELVETTYPVPELLYLKQGGIYAATSAQTASLRNLEDQAVETVLALHSLSASDANAVRTWGRDDVLAQLYLSLADAINATASERTTDQQNAVDWVTAVAKRRNVAAAQNAAREYVKWAGLGRGNFDALMASNPTKAQIETFLSGTPANYDLPTVDATEGWCVYRSPAPYASEYTGYNHPLCPGPFIGVAFPPTPTYEQFVKWGQAKAAYTLLSNQGYLSRAQSLGIALGLALPLAAIAAGSIPASIAAASIASEIALASTTMTAVEITSVTFIAATGVALVATILAALTAAIILGINVTDAATLPGKLAKLVDDARNTTPDIDAVDGRRYCGLTTQTRSTWVLRVCDRYRSGAPSSIAELSCHVHKNGDLRSQP